DAGEGQRTGARGHHRPRARHRRRGREAPEPGRRRRAEEPAVWLYAAGIAWTLHYDTIYAHQDREDDALIGVRSTARLFGTATPAWLWGFTAATAVAGTGAVVAAGAGPLAFAGVAGLAGHMAWQIRALDMGDPDRCLAIFRSTRWGGLALVLGLVLDSLAIT
ncbi:MAG: UbiA family prenyltransferase, partial [Pseudomonadota bacterium]